jgi:hypothetical protein
MLPMNELTREQASAVSGGMAAGDTVQGDVLPPLRPVPGTTFEPPPPQRVDVGTLTSCPFAPAGDLL